MFYKQKPPDISEPAITLSALADMLNRFQDTVLTRIGSVEHTTHVLSKAIHSFMATSSDLVNEVKAHLDAEKSLVDAANALRASVASVVAAHENNGDIDAAIASLKADDASLASVTADVTASTASLTQTAASVPTGVAPGSSPADPTPAETTPAPAAPPTAGGI